MDIINTISGLILSHQYIGIALIVIVQAVFGWKTMKAVIGNTGGRISDRDDRLRQALSNTALAGGMTFAVVFLYLSLNLGFTPGYNDQIEVSVILVALVINLSSNFIFVVKLGKARLSLRKLVD